jgi:actin-like ATPase involved in cell morphogenesis
VSIKVKDNAGRGVDAGTAYFVAAQHEGSDAEGVVRLKSVRNCFLILPFEQASSLDMSGVPYVEGKLGLYVVGADAVELAGVLGGELRRPMSHGFISAKEEQGKELTQLILAQIVGKPLTEDEPVAFSVPGAVYKPETFASAGSGIGNHINLGFHTNFFKEMFAAKGFKPLPVNEAMAVVYSETLKQKREDDAKLTGLAISFGAGMTNVALVYKSLLVRSFSIPIGGDYIDRSAAETTGTSIAQVTLLKEQGVDLRTGTLVKRDDTHDNQSDRQAEAIAMTYRDLLQKLTETANAFFADPANRTEIPVVVPVIVSGGTAMAPGFMEVFDEIFMNGLQARFKFHAEAQLATNPLDSVARGCLTYARMYQQKQK